MNLGITKRPKPVSNYVFLYMGLIHFGRQLCRAAVFVLSALFFSLCFQMTMAIHSFIINAKHEVLLGARLFQWKLWPNSELVETE